MPQNFDKKDELPEALAMLWDQFQREKEPRAKEDWLFKTAEVLTRYMVSMGSTNHPMDILRFPRPTFGQWVGELRAQITPQTKEKKRFEKILTDKSLTAEDVLTLEKLVEIRNHRAHRIAAGEEVSAELIEKFSKILQKTTAYPSPINQSATTPGLYVVDDKDKRIRIYNSTLRRRRASIDCRYDTFHPTNSSDAFDCEDVTYPLGEDTATSSENLASFEMMSCVFGDPQKDDVETILKAIQSEQGFFQIKGGPGSGKSVLLASAYAKAKGDKKNFKAVCFYRFYPWTRYFSWELFTRTVRESLKSAETAGAKPITLFVDGLDVAFLAFPTAQAEFMKLVEGCRVVMTWPNSGTTLSLAFEAGSLLGELQNPGHLEKEQIRQLLDDESWEIAGQLAAFDRSAFRSDDRVNPVIDRIADRSKGNPLWLQLFIEDLRAERLSVLEKKLPNGLQEYALREVDRQAIARRHHDDRILQRLQIPVASLPFINQEESKNYADFDWLENCVKHYDDLFKLPLEQHRVVILKQPIWQPDAPTNRDRRALEEPQIIGGLTIDHLAWYAPHHFSGAEKYGIYLCPEGIVHTAELIRSQLPEGHDLPKERERRILLTWSATLLYLHELGHAFFERLVYSVERFSRDRRYETAKQKYGNLIVMEEALCNTFAWGHLITRDEETQTLLDKEELKSLGDQDWNALLAATRLFMRQQPIGYRDFYEIEELPTAGDENTVFKQNTMRLLHELYGFKDLDDPILLGKPPKPRSRMRWPAPDWEALVPRRVPAYILPLASGMPEPYFNAFNTVWQIDQFQEAFGPFFEKHTKSLVCIFGGHGKFTGIHEKKISKFGSNVVKRIILVNSDLNSLKGIGPMLGICKLFEKQVNAQVMFYPSDGVFAKMLGNNGTQWDIFELQQILIDNNLEDQAHR